LTWVASRPGTIPSSLIASRSANSMLNPWNLRGRGY
jgi:hypothetical protein